MTIQGRDRTNGRRSEIVPVKSLDKECIQYRRLCRDDIEGLCELFYEVFGDGKGPCYWRWKYYENPAGPHASVIALDGRRVVGILGGVPVKMKVGDQSLVVCQGVDTVVAAGYRSASTFFRLEDAATQEMIARGLVFRYAFTIKETYRLFTTARGFYGVRPILNLSKVINPKPYLRKYVAAGFLADMVGGVAKGTIRQWNKKTPAPPDGLDIVDIDRFDNRFDRLWEKEAERFNIAVVRSSGYLNWRYVEAPKKYTVFGLESKDSIKGFVVLACYKEEVVRGRIVDMVLENERKDLADCLVAVALNYFVDQEVDAVTCWIPERRPAWHALRDRGFVERKTPHDLIVRSYFPEIVADDQVSDGSKWYVTMGDGDFY